MASPVRSIGASILGWVIAVIVLVVVFGVVFSFIAFLVRAALFLLVIAVLLALYFRLRGD